MHVVKSNQAPAPPEPIDKQFDAASSASVSDAESVGAEDLAPRSGFHLIELLIVIFILGILAALAIPIFKSYASRAKVSEALSISRNVVLETNMFWNLQGSLPNNLAQLGFTAADLSGTHVESVTLTPAGVIEIQFRASALDGGKLLLTADDSTGTLSWNCSSPDIDPSLLPDHCRP